MFFILMSDFLTTFLKKGTGKYKDIALPKFVRCGKIGHIATRCSEKGPRQNFREGKGKLIREPTMLKMMLVF